MELNLYFQVCPNLVLSHQVPDDLVHKLDDGHGVAGLGKQLGGEVLESLGIYRLSQVETLLFPGMPCQDGHELVIFRMPRVYVQTYIAFFCVCLFDFNIFLMNTTCKKGKMTKNKWLNILLNITKNDLGTTVPYLAHIRAMVSLITHIPVPRTHYTNPQCSAVHTG